MQICQCLLCPRLRAACLYERERERERERETKRPLTLCSRCSDPLAESFRGYNCSAIREHLHRRNDGPRHAFHAALQLPRLNRTFELAEEAAHPEWLMSV